MQQHLEEALFFHLTATTQWSSESPGHDHDARIQFDRNTITFDSLRCLRHCNALGTPVTTHGLDFIPQRPPRCPFALVGEAALLQLHQEEGLQIHTLT